MPIRPLLNMASAAHAHAAIIHGLFLPGGSFNASSRHKSVAVIHRVRPMSSVLICATMIKPGLAARISAA